MLDIDRGLSNKKEELLPTSVLEQQNCQKR